jgi:CDP-glucose 4,6-dehydratase
MMGASSWRGRRVLVTGHTGFKGGWLALWLRSLGADVAGYAQAPPTEPSFFEAVGLGTMVEDHRGDVRDPRAVREVVRGFDPHIVFHLAAQPIVRIGYREPVDTYATNVVGTASVLDACRHASAVRAIVIVTTDKCYENRDWVWGYRENDRLGGCDPYSSSKACAELVTDAFRRSYFIDTASKVGVATARAGNVVGGGDWAEDRLVPDLARAVAARRKALIRNPRAVRPWQHVLEPLAGYLSLAETLLDDPQQFSGAWNFGPDPGSFRSVENVLEAMRGHWHGKLEWSIDAGDQPHEAARLVLDSTKAQTVLGWRPRLSLADALRLTVEWYDAHSSGAADMRLLTETQIARYSAEAN